MRRRKSLRKLLWKIGIDVSRYSNTSIFRKTELIRKFNIDLVLDVGANMGQFATSLREDNDYSGQIVSFEPLSNEYSELAKRASKDPKWKAVNIGLGDSDQTLEINVSENSFSSSFLKMKPLHTEAAPDSVYIKKEKISVKKLDSVFHELVTNNQNIFLKIDAQGYEEKVLNGAEKSLSFIDTIQMEMSLVELYEGESLMFDLLKRMEYLGFHLVQLEQGFSDLKTGQLLQVDGVFHRIS